MSTCPPFRETDTFTKTCVNYRCDGSKIVDAQCLRQDNTRLIGTPLDYVDCHKKNGMIINPGNGQLVCQYNTPVPNYTCPPSVEQGELKQCKNVRCDDKYFIGKCTGNDQQLSVLELDKMKDCANKKGNLIINTYTGQIVCREATPPFPWWGYLLIVLVPLIIIILAVTFRPFG